MTRNQASEYARKSASDLDVPITVYRRNGERYWYCNSPVYHKPEMRTREYAVTWLPERYFQQGD